nr:uncharacterized protein LOC129420903 [Misgurnus anguillicaudatus]XP_055032035.1 uncharacterized protein LOC129420903 [Misgurnus anguillicaudatus]XP_055032037.1 uncharacterized protein LOC129420903 [Misgurnus anguillicaudatus]
MDMVERENVNVANAVIVSGITLSESDQHLEAWLVRYGSISRTLLVDDPTSEFHRHAIIEFAQSSAMKYLQPLLPLSIVSTSDPDVTFMVRALSSVYSPLAKDDVTTGYLEELKAIASASGKPFQEVLQEELEKMRSLSTTPELPRVSERQECPVADSQTRGLSVASLSNDRGSPATSQRMRDHRDMTSLPSVSPMLNAEHMQTQNLSKENTVPSVGGVSSPSATGMPRQSLTMDIIDPPAVQRVVVEHVVRTSDMTTQHSSLRLRSFSGKIPRPPNEPDFETWRANVEFLLDDPSVSDLSRTRRILDSLLPPAADVIKHISPQSSPLVYLELLQSVYGSVEDGEELLAKFMTMLQNQGERPSSYLHRLQVILSATVRRGGIAESERNRYLLKQFCRGCWDSSLIANLQLERRKNNPPSFAELVVSVRTEEDRQASKEDRMRSHFGMTKQGPAPSKLRTAAHQWSAHSHEVVGGASPVTDSMRKQISEIHAQLACTKPLTHHRECSSECSVDVDVTSLQKELTALRAQVQAMEATVSRKVQNKSSEHGEISELARQIAELKAHLTVHEPCESQPGRPSVFRNPTTMSRSKQIRSEESKSVNESGLPLARPRPGYCFRCGEDAHIAVNCENEPNPAKVQIKRNQLREKQAQWDLKHRVECPQLNSKPSL